MIMPVNHASRVRYNGTTSGRSLLTQSDFTYQGYYDVVDGLTEAGLGSGLTYRYISGTFTGLFCEYYSNAFHLTKFTLPGSYGSEVTVSGGIDDIWNGYATSAEKIGIWWDESLGGLWSNQAVDYGDSTVRQRTAAISFREINSGGTVSNWAGYWGFENVGQRAVYGGVRHVPTYFQTANSVGAYLFGFGGYTSLMAQTKGPSLGPMFIFMDNPNGVFSGTSDTDTNGIPASGNWKLGADYRGGAANSSDYGTDYDNRTYDRGSRKTLTVTNWFGNDNRGNPSSRPTYPTDLVASNLQEWWTGDGGASAPNDPYGYGRWTWGDTYNGCCEWIDTDSGDRTRHGIVCVASLRDGYVWYETSDLHFDEVEYEIHVFDPDQVAEVTAGTRDVFDIAPTYAWSIKSLLEGLQTGSGNGSAQQDRQIAGSAFDPTTNLLYLALYNVPNGTNASKMRLYVFLVGGS